MRYPLPALLSGCALLETDTAIVKLALESPAENPLSAIPEFRAFQEGIQAWLAEPSIPEPLTVIGSYNLY